MAGSKQWSQPKSQMEREWGKEREREESKKKKKAEMPEKKKMKWGFKGAGDNETIRVYCMNDVKRGERKS